MKGSFKMAIIMEKGLCYLNVDKSFKALSKMVPKMDKDGSKPPMAMKFLPNGEIIIDTERASSKPMDIK